MRMCDCRQFFEDADKRLSMSRLLLFGSFVTATAIMLLLTYSKEMTWGYFSTYLTAFTGSYLGGKGLDKMRNGNEPKGKK